MVRIGSVIGSAPLLLVVGSIFRLRGGQNLERFKFVREQLKHGLLGFAALNTFSDLVNLYLHGTYFAFKSCMVKNWSRNIIKSY
jgi:hypothetical protein